MFRTPLTLRRSGMWKSSGGTSGTTSFGFGGDDLSSSRSAAVDKLLVESGDNLFSSSCRGNTEPGFYADGSGPAGMTHDNMPRAAFTHGKFGQPHIAATLFEEQRRRRFKSRYWISTQQLNKARRRDDHKSNRSGVAVFKPSDVKILPQERDKGVRLCLQHAGGRPVFRLQHVDTLDAEELKYFLMENPVPESWTEESKRNAPCCFIQGRWKNSAHDLDAVRLMNQFVSELQLSTNWWISAQDTKDYQLRTAVEPDPAGTSIHDVFNKDRGTEGRQYEALVPSFVDLRDGTEATFWNADQTYEPEALTPPQQAINRVLIQEGNS